MSFLFVLVVVSLTSTFTSIAVSTPIVNPFTAKNFYVIIRVDAYRKGAKTMKSKTSNMWEIQPRKNNLFAQKFDEPLSKKNVSVRLPVSAMEFLDKMPSDERLNFIRSTLCKAIAAKTEKYPTGGGAGTVIR